MEDIYRKPAKRGMQYKIIVIPWSNNSGWVNQLEMKLEKLSEDGWRPILYSDGGESNTVILEKPHDD